MSDTAKRQAELDALRERQITNNNAKALKGSVLPINMDDWNAQQKALKEEERQKKSDSASILHNYKGITDVSALTRLKEEDRAKQMQAQKQLHDYRDRFVGTGTRRKDREQIVVDASGSMEDDSTSGISVSDAVASFGTPGNQTEVRSSEPSNGLVMVEKPDDPLMMEPMVMVSDKSPSSSDGTGNDGSSHDWISVPHPEPPAADEWSQMTMKQDNVAEDPPSPTPAPTAVNVDFTFALLTTEDTPDVDKYMKAAAFIVGDSAAGESVVKSVKQYPLDRPGVRKFVVTATLPYMISSGLTSEESRRRVLGLLKKSVQDGTFFSTACS